MMILGRPGRWTDLGGTQRSCPRWYGARYWDRVRTANVQRIAIYYAILFLNFLLKMQKEIAPENWHFRLQFAIHSLNPHHNWFSPGCPLRDCCVRAFHVCTTKSIILNAKFIDVNAKFIDINAKFIDINANRFQDEVPRDLLHAPGSFSLSWRILIAIEESPFDVFKCRLRKQRNHVASTQMHVTPTVRWPLELILLLNFE